MQVDLTFRKETVDGMRVDALKSGLQKYIRRGEGGKAMRCAYRLHCVALGKVSTRGKGLFTNLIHRLMVILLEDCGPAMASDLLVKVALQLVRFFQCVCVCDCC